MPFIGNTPDVNFTSFAKQDLTGVTGSPAKRGYTLTHAVANANEIEVFVNNVRQEPTESYTVNGTGLTMTGDVETSDDFYIIYLGKAIQTTVTPDGSVSTAKIADSAVTNAKINNSTIDLTSKVTGVLPVANGGTGVSSGFSYAEGTWTPTIAGSNVLSGSWTVTLAKYTKIGQLVNCIFRVNSSGASGNWATSDYISIGGFPFTTASQAYGTAVSASNFGTGAVSFFHITVADPADTSAFANPVAVNGTTPRSNQLMGGFSYFTDQ